MSPPFPRRALVLAAGLGTRLRPLSDVRAKPAVPLAGEPLVRRIIRWLVASGVTELVLNLHHRPETIAAVVGDGRDLGACVRYSWEQPAVLGSAGGPRLALSLLGTDTFWLVNGDTLTDVDLPALARVHAASGAMATLALAPTRDATRYGGVQLDGEGFVTGFVARGNTAQAHHFTGVQLVSSALFADLTPGQPRDSIGDVYNDWIARRPRVIAGFETLAPFSDIGTVEDYWRTSRAWITREDSPDAWRGSSVTIDRTARVAESILWDRITIGANSVLDRCIVLDDVSVPEGSIYTSAVLHRGEDGQIVTTPFHAT